MRRHLGGWGRGEGVGVGGWGVWGSGGVGVGCAGSPIWEPKPQERTKDRTGPPSRVERRHTHTHVPPRLMCTHTQPGPAPPCGSAPKSATKPNALRFNDASRLRLAQARAHANAHARAPCVCVSVRARNVRKNCPVLALFFLGLQRRSAGPPPVLRRSPRLRLHPSCPKPHARLAEGRGWAGTTAR